MQVSIVKCCESQLQILVTRRTNLNASQPPNFSKTCLTVQVSFKLEPCTYTTYDAQFFKNACYFITRNRTNKHAFRQ